jgi:hypothetical protein
LWKGDAEERIIASVLVIAAAGSSLTRDHNWLGVQWGLLATDLPVLAIMVWIALRTRRWWPLFAAAFEFLAILTHTASMIDRSLGNWAYVTAGVIWSYGMLLSVFVGTVNTMRLRARTRRDDARHDAGSRAS